MSEPVAPTSVEVIIKLDNGRVIVATLTTQRVYDISATIQREMQEGIPIVGATPRWTIGAGGPGDIMMYDDVVEYETVTGNLRLGLIEENERLRSALALVDGGHCENFTGAGYHCFKNGRTADAESGCERACTSCVAHRGLVP